MAGSSEMQSHTVRTTRTLNSKQSPDRRTRWRQRGILEKGGDIKIGYGKKRESKEKTTKYQNIIKKPSRLRVIQSVEKKKNKEKECMGVLRVCNCHRPSIYAQYVTPQPHSKMRAPYDCGGCRVGAVSRGGLIRNSAAIAT